MMAAKQQSDAVEAVREGGRRQGEYHRARPRSRAQLDSERETYKAKIGSSTVLGQ